MNDDWNEILSHSRELCDLFPEGLAFIGGIATYAHTQDHAQFKRLAETSHDVDLVIARVDFMDLRDIEVVTTNRRLNKHEFRRDKLQFDVYEEGSSGLIVPVPEIIASSQIKDGLRVACVEHLLALKLEAYKDRRSTSKGEKDANDAFKIILVASETALSPTRLAYLSDEHIELLKDIRRQPTALRLCQKNAHDARNLNNIFDASFGRLIEAVKQNDGKGDPKTPKGKDGPPGYGE